GAAHASLTRHSSKSRLPAKRRLARFFVFRSVLGRVFRRFLRRLFFFDGKQLHFKDQCGVGPDLRTRLARSVGQFGRHKELPLRSDGHQLQRFRPSLDDLVYREAGRPAVLFGAVEFRIVQQRASVIANHSVLSRRFRTGPFLQNLVLKPARQSHHAFLGLVGGEERIPVLLVLVCLGLKLILLMLAHFHLQFR